MVANLKTLPDSGIIAKDRIGTIGEPVPRREGPLKVTGHAPYSYEYKGFGEAAYGFMVCASIAKGRIVEIDATVAERAPGVLLVLTYKNAPKQAAPAARSSPDRYSSPAPFLFQPEVRYYGEPVALVIANTYEAARHASYLVSVQYEKANDAVFNLEESKPQAYRPEKVNAGMETDTKSGDFDAAFAKAAVKVDATYIVPYEHCMPMEPHAALAIWEDEQLTLWSPQQIPAMAHTCVAKTLQIKPEQVRIVTPYIGGGFGSKVPVHAHTILAALGAKVLGRPVKVAQTRQQMFANTNHRPRGIQEMRLGAERDGTLTAIAHQVWMQTTPYIEFVEQAAAFSRTLYAAPNRRHEHRAISLDLPPSDIMRAPGEEPGSIAMECGMDELAHALGMDPIELRLKNEPQVDPENHLPFSSRSLVECLEEGAKRFGWEKRPKQPGTLRDGKFLIGYGVACGTFPARSMRNAATVRMNSDGSVIVKMSASDIGTGTFTIMAQVTAQELDVPIDSVTIEIGDSKLPRAAGSGGSFGAASAVMAIHMACLKLREELGDRDIRTLAEGIEVSVEHKGSENPPKYSAHSFGAQFAEVAVDVDTAEIRVRRMLGVFACGRILNARTARSQLIGGMLMGLGAGLTEESVVDTRDGSFVNHDIAEYHVPVHADVPAEIDAIFIPEHDDKVNALGVKGLGEVGIVGVGAALANAVFNATGVRVREFPVTLDKVLAGLPPA